MTEIISQLTPEQEALIPVIHEKWRQIALSTEPLDRKKAANAVRVAYSLMGKQQPHLLFFNSPHEAFNTVILNQLGRLLNSELWNSIGRELEKELWSQIDNTLDGKLWNQIGKLLESELERQFCYYTEREVWACYGGWFDFCISVLNCTYSSKKWTAFQLLAESCGWIYSFEKTFIVCDRPRKISLDNQQRLHAEGEPALQFADGYSLYSYHGVTFPEKYGKIHPNQWRSQWLLEEENAELRRVLIQGIGYARICQELEAEVLDTWKEYTLLRISDDIERFDIDIYDFEKDDGFPQKELIYLLKMTCPSTGYIHALRVPPAMTSAREAIRWVNWGIDPEEFSQQT